MPRPRSQQARQAVLAAVLRAVAEEGFASVTIEGLALEAGISKQTIYRWWSSKAEILGEALLDGTQPGVFESVPMTDDLEADLRAYLAAITADQGNTEGIEITRALIAVTATNPELGERLNALLGARTRHWVTERLDRARETGALRADIDTSIVAEQLIAISSYAALMGKPLSDAHVNAVAQMIVRGIGK